MNPRLISAPTITPFLLNDVKDYLGIYNSDSDARISDLIQAVARSAEIITRRTLFTSTWSYFLDCFPGREILLPKPPVQSVSYVKYYDTAGALQTLDAANYQLDVVSEPARLGVAPNITWPSTESGRYNAVEIQYVAGYTSRGQLPAGLAQAMLYHIQHLYDFRAPYVSGMSVAEVPFSIEAHYAPYRVWSFF